MSFSAISAAALASVIALSGAGNVSAGADPYAPRDFRCVNVGSEPIEAFDADDPAQRIGMIPVAAFIDCGPEGASTREVVIDRIEGFASKIGLAEIPEFEDGLFTLEREVHDEAWDTGRSPAIFVAPVDGAPEVARLKAGETVTLADLDVPASEDVIARSIESGEYPPEWWPVRSSGGSVDGWWPARTADGEVGFVHSRHVSLPSEQSAEERAQRGEGEGSEDGSADPSASADEQKVAPSKDAATDSAASDSNSSIPWVIGALGALLIAGIAGERLATARRKKTREHTHES